MIEQELERATIDLDRARPGWKQELAQRRHVHILLRLRKLARTYQHLRTTADPGWTIWILTDRHLATLGALAGADIQRLNIYQTDNHRPAFLELQLRFRGQAPESFFPWIVPLPLSRQYGATYLEAALNTLNWITLSHRQHRRKMRAGKAGYLPWRSGHA